MSENFIIWTVIIIFSAIGAIATYFAIKSMEKREARSTENFLARAQEYESKSFKDLGRLSLYYIVSIVLIILFFVFIY